MGLAIEKAGAEKTHRTYARLAGSLLLGVILVALVGGSILSHVAGDGSFAEQQQGSHRRNGCIERLSALC